MTKIWEVAKRTEKSLLDQLLVNRGVSLEDWETFLNPPRPELLLTDYRDQFKLSWPAVEAAVGLVREAIERNQPIVIHGDYDVDGISGAAILWEAIYWGLGYQNCQPFIPDRFKDSYGLTEASVRRIKEEVLAGKDDNGALLLTIDCGISADAAVEFANSQGLTVVIVDHHQPKKTLPPAEVIVWDDGICSGALAWVLASQLLGFKAAEKYLDLVALATVADMQPLVGVNRSLVKYGLEAINQRSRPGLEALLKQAGVSERTVGTYEVGWRLGPRLNAAGRLEDSMDALRLLCTTNLQQAKKLAERLGRLNTERQQVTEAMFGHAQGEVPEKLPKILVLANDSYHEGVIGLVAQKLAREYYRPAVVISRGEGISKGSARSVKGFNLIAALRQVEDLFEDVGGHPMAAGFTVKTEKIDTLIMSLTKLGEAAISDEILVPVVAIDAEVYLAEADNQLFKQIDQLAPFGLGNPAPTLVSFAVSVLDAQAVGKSKNHLKLRLIKSPESLETIEAIAFGWGKLVEEILPGEKVDLVYRLEKDTWNGHDRLQLMVREIRLEKNDV